MERISVLVADDHSLVRAGFRSILGDEDDIDVVGEAKDGAEAVEAAVRERPDVVLMDIRMPGTGRPRGDPPASPLDPRLRGTKVIVLTTFDLDEYVFGALKAGASGFLLKGVEPPALIDAVRTVAGGDALLEPSVTRRLIEAYVDGQQAAPPRQASRFPHRSPPGRSRSSGSSPRAWTNTEIAGAPVHQPADLQIARLADPDQAGRQGPHPAGRPRLRERPDRPRADQRPARIPSQN